MNLNTRNLRLIATFSAGLLVAGPLWPQSLPPLFQDAPREKAAHTPVAELPQKTFLENIAVDAAGTLFFTSYEDGVIYRLRRDGKPEQFARVNGNATGIALERKGNLLVTARSDNKAVVFRITDKGVVKPLATIEGGQFLNGITRLSGNRYLVADSYRGAIWEVNADSGAARVWLEDPLLARSDTKNPFPAVNGLKVFGSVLYASNTERKLLLRIPLRSGGQPRSPEIFVRNVNLDDFAFDRRGNLYATTHVYNSLVRISPKGSVTILADADQGMAGSTAAAFGRTPADRTSLYVTTNGGMSFPPPGGVQPAKVVRVNVGVAGD